MAGLRQLAERSLRKFAGPVYRMLQRRSGQRLAKRFTTAEDRFKHIYETNHWDETESVSGPGSTLQETQPLRQLLPELLRELKAETLLDVPCGDFHWMQHTDISCVRYIGGDLVGDLIERNQAKHLRDGVEFRKIDLVNDMLPSADVILCRDCLVHMSFAHAQVALSNIARSEAKWFLTTNFPHVMRNHDIVTGQWRPINLTLSPFNLPESKKVITENCTETEFADKTLSLWAVESLKQLS
ncbi:MAG: class I SAM-dependent methyltransferase [Verrucomicrobiota bacterium]|nr:class I SAM-dependent methyltransferase [Verrucomicrobiota bacterium]